MLKKFCLPGVVILLMGFCNTSFGQHGHDDHGDQDDHGGHDDHGDHDDHGGSSWHFGFGGSGGHFDLHNGHVDYHEPGHFDIHNDHLDYHPGYVEHYVPVVGHHVDPYYYDRPIIGGSVIFPNNSYGPNSIYQPGIIDNVPPSNALPSNPVVAGYVPNQGPINLVNPVDYATALSFKINNEPLRLEPGQDTTIAFDRSIVIEFHRGGDFGTARYSLRDGNYKFVVGEQGWDLKKAKPVLAPADTNTLPDTNAIPVNPLPGDGN